MTVRIPPEVLIRLYEVRDAGAISELIATTMRISNAADYPLDRLQMLIDYFTPSKVQQINEDRDCFVAEANGRLVGTAALGGAQVVTFFVHPDYQRRGIGTALLRALESRAAERGLSQLHVESSLAGARFYQSQGFHRIGEPTEGIAGTHLPMVKSIRAEART